MVDRKRFNHACRIWLDGMTKDVTPAIGNYPAIEWPYRAADLVDVFGALAPEEKRELLWLLNLYVDADEAPPPMNIAPPSPEAKGE